jgi:hypothetical protein
LVANKYTRQINALGLRWRRAEPGPWRIDPEGGGERIVAFARPGKPPGIPFLLQINASGATQTGLILCELSTVFKPCWGTDEAGAFSGKVDSALPREIALL